MWRVLRLQRSGFGKYTLLGLFLLIFVHCSDRRRNPPRLEGGSSPESEFAVDDDSSAPEDDDEESDDDATDHWPTDDDGDDDWFQPDDDDDDDAGPPGIWGWVVGEGVDGDRAFAALVRHGRVRRRDISSGYGVRLEAIAMHDEDLGIAVGADTENESGAIYRVSSESLNRIDAPAVDPAWTLYDVAMVSANEAFMVGYRTVGNNLVGLILHYEGGVVTVEELPERQGWWVLAAVSFAGESLGWAVGRDETTDQPLILGYYDGRWFEGEVPEVLNQGRLVDVDFQKPSFAVAVGDKIAPGNLEKTPLALRWDGSSWIETLVFTGGLLGWSFNNISLTPEDEGLAYVMKGDQLEQWRLRFDGEFWSWGRSSFWLPDLAGAVTSAGILDKENGLMALDSWGENATVVTRFESTWSRIEDTPPTMGAIYGVAVVGKD